MEGRVNKVYGHCPHGRSMTTCHVCHTVKLPTLNLDNATELLNRNDMSRYERMIKDIRKVYPLSSPDRIYFENPLDCAFLIEVDNHGNETHDSLLKNLGIVDDYRARREMEYEFK